MWGDHSQPNSNWNWSADGTPDQQQQPNNNQVHQNNIGHQELVCPQQQPTYHDGLQPTSWNWSAESNVPPDQQQHSWNDYAYQNTVDPQMCLQQQPPYFDGQYVWQPSVLPADQTPWQYSGSVWDNQLAYSGDNLIDNSSIPHAAEQSVELTNAGSDNRPSLLQVSQQDSHSHLHDKNVAANGITTVSPHLVDADNNGSTVALGNFHVARPTSSVMQKSNDHIEKVAVDENNQEVPEPSPNVDLHQPYFHQPDAQVDSLENGSTQVVEESPNQQNPSENIITNARIEESRNVVIKPREGSLFQPPSHQSTSSANKPVVQREAAIDTTPLVTSEPESANLETEPDNLERPPDVDSSRRQHIHMNLHRPHHVAKLDSTTLWESPDIPSVTFIPSLVGLPDSTLANSKQSDVTESADLKEAIFDRTQVEDRKEKSEEQAKQIESNVEPKIPEVEMHATEINLSSRTSRALETSPSPYPQSKHIPSENIPNTSIEYEDKYRLRANVSPHSRNDRTYDSEEIRNHRSNHHQRIRDDDRHRNYDYDERRPRDEYHSSNSRPSSRLSETSNYERYYNDGEGRRHHYAGRERTPSRLNESENYHRANESENYHRADRHRNEEYVSSKSSRTAEPAHYDRYCNDNDGRRYHYSERERTPSRQSETEQYMHADHRSRGEEYANSKQYGDRSSRYNREHDYYQRSKYSKSYGYGDYREEQPYYNYYDSYNRRYASNYNSYDYGFYDELYRTDSRYRQQVDQYRSYYENYGEPDLDRLSLHSSHSSIADELRKDTMLETYGKEYDRSSNYSVSSQNTQPFGNAYHEGYSESSRLDAESALDATQHRLTPYKFTCSHVVARLSAGRLIKVVQNSSASIVATVEIHDLQSILDTEDVQQEMKSFPGPLVRGQTHKNDVMHFCHQKIKDLRETEQISDRDGQILLWELLVMLLRQNGSVVGSDIAELLLKEHEILQPPKIPKSTSDTLTDNGGIGETSDIQSPDEGIVVSQDRTVLRSVTPLSREHTIQKFREYLLFGHKKDALEWAMKNALWGHALFLASKVDPRTYANVMTRFANSLTLNDPLQSLYQLMSGRQPAAVTSVVDENWGDWRPHLAMILSNPSSHPEVDQRSITTLGDTLAQTGYLCAAHFCYLMAQVDFGSFEVKSSKLVLLGSSQLLSFSEFSCCKAIQCTEIYEYAQSLANPNFFLLHLQPYKFIYATRLAEYGFLQEALHYCEILSETAIQMSVHMCTEVSYVLLCQISELARKLKYYDPSFSHGQGELEEQSDPVWLQKLLQLLESLKMSTTPLGTSANNTENQTVVSNAPVMQPYVTDHADTSSQHYEQYSAEQNYNSIQQDYQPNSSWSSTTYLSPVSQVNASEGSMYGEQSFNAEHSLYQPTPVENVEENHTSGANLSPSYNKTSTGFDYYGFSTQQTLARERQDSVNSLGRRSSGASTVSNAVPAIPANKQENGEDPRKIDKKESRKPQTGRSWLGGIFGKLLPKGPNQMILPDDKNPTIVWDPVTNKWVNKGSEESSAEAPPVAPPTDLELNKNLKQPDMPLSPPPPTGVNKFQRPKTKGMRQNYVDVLNTSNKSKITMEDKIPNNSETIPTPVSSYLIPSPGTETDGLATDVISPTGLLLPPISQAPESNYQVTNPEDIMPTMFDPAEFSTSHNINDGKVKTSRLGRRSYQR